MSPLLPLALMLLTAPPAKSARPDGSRYEQGQRLFLTGDVDAALKALDLAAAEGGDQATQEKVHLLRAQCFAARQDFARTEEAFTQALEANPEASLDPARVDPTLVKLLESVRGRLTGTVQAHATPEGAALSLDGQPVGAAPQALQVKVGRHRLGATWPDGALAEVALQVRPRREQQVAFVRGGGSGAADWPQPRPVRPYGELRGALDVPSAQAPLLVDLQVGGGFEFHYFRAGLSARFFPFFGVTPRFQFALPVMERVQVLLELALPVSFLSQGVGLGLSGAGGVEVALVKWFGAFALIGGRHFLLPRLNDATAFTATAGVRLRLP